MTYNIDFLIAAMVILLLDRAIPMTVTLLAIMVVLTFGFQN